MTDSGAAGPDTGTTDARNTDTGTAGVAGPTLERRLALLLAVGTVVASTVVLAGVVLSALGRHGPGRGLVVAGVAGFVALPVSRLAVMLGTYLSRRDGRLTVVTGVVLLLTFCALAVGLRAG